MLDPLSFTKTTPPHLRKKPSGGSGDATAPRTVPVFKMENYDDHAFAPKPVSEASNFVTAWQPSSPSPLSQVHFGAFNASASSALENSWNASESASGEPSLFKEVSEDAKPLKESSQEMSSPTAARGTSAADAPFPSPSAALATPVKHYQAKDLLSIGRQCGNRLPPASAVQAMFLYEMQRQTEAERLFNAHMFRLARSEEDIAAQANRFNDIDARMSKLEQRLASSNSEARITSSEGRLLEYQQQVIECTERLSSVESNAESLKAQLDKLQQNQVKGSADAANTVKQAAQSALEAAANGGRSSQAFNTDAFELMKKEIEALSKTRDDVLAKLNHTNVRIDHLLAAVQILAGHAPHMEPTSPATVQGVPNIINSEPLMDVGDAKEKPIVGLGGSMHAIPKSFTPGTIWSR